jgi:hypothetical protein
LILPDVAAAAKRHSVENCKTERLSIPTQWRGWNSSPWRRGRAQQAKSAAMIVDIDRFAQPLHYVFDICRLQMAPAFNLGLVSVFWKSFEIFFGQLAGG